MYRDIAYRDIFYISRYAIYRDIFWSYRDTNVHGYSEIDGERRKYTNSHSADATSVGPHHAHTFEFSCGAAVLRTYIL